MKITVSWEVTPFSLLGVSVSKKSATPNCREQFAWRGEEKNRAPTGTRTPNPLAVKPVVIPTALPRIFKSLCNLVN
jgi:hypothetical protein